MWTPFTLAELWRVDISVIISLVEQGKLKGTLNAAGEWEITNTSVNRFLERRVHPKRRGFHAG